MDVEVLPLLGGGFVETLKAVLLLFFLERLGGHGVFWLELTQILLCGDEHDGDAQLDFTDLSLPLGDGLDGAHLDRVAAEEEQVGALVDNFTVLRDVLVTRSIVDFELNHLLVDVLGAFVDIQHSGLVVVAESVMKVVLY